MERTPHPKVPWRPIGWTRIGGNSESWLDGPLDSTAEVRIVTVGSIAIMCPTSHEGVPVKLFLHRRLLRFRAPWRIQFLSKAELSSQQGTSPATSHPAGRCPNHGPTFGTGELQEGGTTLLERRFRARPDNGDAPLDPYTRAARRPWLNQRC